MNPHRHGSRRRAAGLIAIVMVAVTGALAPAMAAAKPAKVKVMTRNLYLGADLGPAIGAPSPAAAMFAAGNIYRSVIDTNFTARARLIADEIEAARPDLIGLQEVALWRRGQRGAADGPATPATEVFVDYLDILRNELRKRGLAYKVAVRQLEADIELPVDLGTADAPDGSPEFDGRLSMSDVILVRRSTRIETKKPRAKRYVAKLSVPTALGTVTIDRGWTSIDATKKAGRGVQKFRFVNTHLEAFSAYVRTGQAAELVGTDGPFGGGMAKILVGDLNSDPDDPSSSTSPPDPVATPNAAAYGLVTGAGFVDLGVTVPTCCFGADVLDPAPTFDSRIDHVMAHGKVSGINAALIGVDPAKRTNSDLWPSDHGGVIAKLRVR